MKRLFLASILTGVCFFTAAHSSEEMVDLLAEHKVPCVECSADEEDSPWGYHLVLDCKGCDIGAITSKDLLTRFVKVLVQEIDMKAYGEPILEYFAEHNPDAAGYSLLQLIETSSITGHFVTKNGDCYLDVFSCKYFDPKIAKKVVDSFLGPESVKMIFLYRKA